MQDYFSESWNILEKQVCPGCGKVLHARRFRVVVTTTRIGSLQLSMVLMDAGFEDFVIEEIG